MHGKRLWLVALALLALVPFFVTDTFAKKGGNKPPPPPPPPSSPADPAIVYRTGNWDRLEVMNSDGSHQTTIYQGPDDSILWTPSWSGDGLHVSFVEEEYNRPEPNDILCRIDVEVVDGVPQGSNRTVLVDDIVVWDAAWSPLSDRIAFVAERTPDDPLTRDVRMIGANGGPQQILYTPPQGRGIARVQWSPEGNRIAFLEWDDAIHIEEVRVLDLTTGGITTSRLPNYDSGWLVWAKTQDVFAYAVRVSSYTTNIHLLDLATGETQYLCEGTYPTWSPDDSQIIFRGWIESKRKPKVRYGIVKYTLATGEKELPFEGSAHAFDWKR